MLLAGEDGIPLDVTGMMPPGEGEDNTDMYPVLGSLDSMSASRV